MCVRYQSDYPRDNINAGIKLFVEITTKPVEIETFPIYF